MEEYALVVGTAFIKDGALLIAMSESSSKKGKFTLIGGFVDEGETIKEAARRECQEEIGAGFDIEEDELLIIKTYREPALSDPNLLIEMNLLLALKELDVELVPNDEILEYKWFKLGDDESILSTAVKDHFIPWAVENNVMY
ncbi:MAG: NUDIX domain-containing protein [Bacilli bacterium]|nr:NUDIX domain-containing protein [Bacilli bacterium]MDD4407745.1 NUDIX domain-containing protein [Bacilli bacterium]